MNGAMNGFMSPMLIQKVKGMLSEAGEIPFGNSSTPIQESDNSPMVTPMQEMDQNTSVTPMGEFNIGSNVTPQNNIEMGNYTNPMSEFDLGNLESSGDSGENKYPLAQNIVDGREVINKESIPNMSSIQASINNPNILQGIREVPMSDFSLTGKHYSVEGTNKIRKLQSDIKASNKITPLIVVVDKDGPYILEGSTRADALHNIGAKSFPAIVVLDNGQIAEGI